MRLKLCAVVTSAAGQDANVKHLARDLHEALEHQTATSEVLRIISSSPGDLNAAFQAILANATKLCQASYGTLWLCEGMRSALPRSTESCTPPIWSGYGPAHCSGSVHISLRSKP
jgi:hypothetical protein